MARKPTKLKDAIRQIHLWLGLGTGIVVFIISITGCLYVFEQEIRELTQKDRLFVPEMQKPFIGVATVVRNFEKIAPTEKITRIERVNNIPNATVAIVSNKKKVYYFNPYTGGLVKKTGIDWLDTVEHIHTSLLLDEPGKFIIRWSVVLFVILLISGFVLWFPNQMRLLKQSLTIKWGASFKRVNYDLHNVLGFYSSWILIVIACSGLYFAFDSVKHTVTFLSGSEISKPVKVAPAAIIPAEDVAVRYQDVFTQAEHDYPGANTTVLSTRKGGELRLRLIYPYQWLRLQNTFFFDEANGHMLRYKLYKNNTAADKIEASNYDLHTGQLFGLFGKIVAFVMSLISASLPITGFIIWYKKQKKAKKKKPALR
jgi:uncharacterized iron-regulated membrane protein